MRGIIRKNVECGCDCVGAVPCARPGAGTGRAGTARTGNIHVGAEKRRIMSRWDPFEDDDPLMAALSRKAMKTGIPLSGVISFTARCNFRCVHCYIANAVGSFPYEIDTPTYKRIIDEIADVGTLFLTITGGEPMIRSDFTELYSYIKQRGFMISLFSNGTLITEEIIALLKDLPPRHVDITVYGASEETYYAVTGIRGMYQRCIEGIESLLRNEIKVRLKTVLMKPNIDDFSKIKKMAEEYGVPYRIDQMIFGRFNGDKAPLALRITPEVGVKCEMQMDGLQESIKRMLDETLPISDKLYNCGAGRSTFYVTEIGKLRPCLMITDIEADLNKYSFRDAWKSVNEKIVSLPAEENDECNWCDMRAICGYCPPMGKLSSLDGDIKKEYFCKIGRARRMVIY